MANWKQYVFTVIVCSLSCGILSEILTDTKGKALVRFTSGILLALVILEPLSQIHLNDLLGVSYPDMDATDHWIAQGKKIAGEAQTEHIKASCEAYLLDKANKLGANIRPKILLDKNRIPAFAEIEGTVKRDVQMQLQNILTEDLGIPKENQIWIWNQENSIS